MIAIIPARGGSKGLPGKNIKPLNGKPLIAYTIEAAKKSRYINRIIVSTDDKNIAKYAEEFGAEVPFLRPSEFAKDDSKAIDVYFYTINKLNSEFGANIENFIVLQPTSPLRTSDDIDNSIQLFYEKNADSVISIVESKHPPNWIRQINTDGILESFFDEEDNLNRQEYKKTYLPNGAIFIFNYNKLINSKKYYMSKTYPYIMPEERSIDIDTIIDFKLASTLLKNIL